MKLTTLGLISALMMAITVPMPAQAGTMTIINKNCTKLKGFKTVKRVTVHVYGGPGCTEARVTIPKGSMKVIDLIETTTESRIDDDPIFADAPESSDTVRECKYHHEAKGTVGGKKDVSGKQNTRVTCRKDFLGICQCTKGLDLPR